MKKMQLSQLHVKAGELPFVAGKVGGNHCCHWSDILGLSKAV